MNRGKQIFECSPEKLQALLEQGANFHTFDMYNNTPLHNACECFNGDLKIIKLLLKYGSPINVENACCESPLHVSLQNPLCTQELVKLLLQFNAKVTAKILRVALQSLHDNSLNIFTELIQHAFMTSVYEWSAILEDLLMNVIDEQMMMDIGKLIIKYTILNCDKPPTRFSETFEQFSNRGFRYITLFDENRVTHIISKTVLTNKSYLPIVCRNLKCFLDDCFSEIKRMKTDILQNNISVYHLIVSKTGKVRLNEQILQIIKENKFPIYNDIILNKIKRDALLDKLVRQQIYTVVQHDDRTRRIILDTFSVCNLAKYLRVDELRNFVDAFHNPSENEYCFWDSLLEIETCLSETPQVSQVATKKKQGSRVAAKKKQVSRVATKKKQVSRVATKKKQVSRIATKKKKFLG